MQHPIADKAEVTIDFPDKFYMGGFGRDCAFEARAEAEGVLIRLVRAGEDKRVAEVHLHHLLFANILDELARSISEHETINDPHRGPLLKAAQNLATALETRRSPAG
jgi:hypothetical protein